MKNKGFTLIEIIIVMVVIAISSLGLVVAMQQTLISIHKPRITQTAAFLAEREAERILNTGFAGVVAEASAAYTGSFSQYTHQVAITNQTIYTANDAKVVDIIVAHSAVGSVRLPLLKTNY